MIISYNLFSEDVNAKGYKSSHILYAMSQFNVRGQNEMTSLKILWHSLSNIKMLYLFQGFKSLSKIYPGVSIWDLFFTVHSNWLPT